MVHHPPRQVGEDIELARGERFDQALLLACARFQAGDDLPERSIAEPRGRTAASANHAQGSRHLEEGPAQTLGARCRDGLPQRPVGTPLVALGAQHAELVQPTAYLSSHVTHRGSPLVEGSPRRRDVPRGQGQINSRGGQYRAFRYAGRHGPRAVQVPGGDQ